MKITTEQRKHFRTLGHNLKPVVTIAGNGLSESVLEEINRALNDHELLKVKLAIADRDVRKQVITELCTQAPCLLIQEIGKIALIFRKADKPNLKLSNLTR